MQLELELYLKSLERALIKTDKGEESRAMVIAHKGKIVTIVARAVQGRLLFSHCFRFFL